MYEANLETLSKIHTEVYFGLSDVYLNLIETKQWTPKKEHQTMPNVNLTNYQMLISV